MSKIQQAANLIDKVTATRELEKHLYPICKGKLTSSEMDALALSLSDFWDSAYEAGRFGCRFDPEAAEEEAKGL
jgi:hypothetical protein